MAWTTDAERADWFARRWRISGKLAYRFTATIEPGGVLALIDGRDEHEVVVDPAMLPRSHRSLRVAPREIDALTS
jgi:hypothetical protein